MDQKQLQYDSLNQQVIRSSESVIRSVLFGVSGLVLLILVGFFVSLYLKSAVSRQAFGFPFFIDSTWDPVFQEFGALPFIIGTLTTSFIALFLSIPISLSLSIFLGEYFRKGPVSLLLKSTIDLLAGIPSVIYGFWGLFVLVPFIQSIQLSIGAVPYGIGIFTSSLILAVMIIPYSASLGREVVGLVPDELKEAAYGLGATRFEVVKTVIIPYAKSGLFSGFLLSLGRALGETMAVTMVIGNSNMMPSSLFGPGNSMASIIANEFAESTDPVHISSLIEIGLILMIISVIISFIGRRIIKKWSVG